MPLLYYVFFAGMFLTPLPFFNDFSYPEQFLTINNPSINLSKCWQQITSIHYIYPKFFRYFYRYLNIHLNAISMFTLTFLFLFVLILFFVGVSKYNTLVRNRNATQAAFSTIDVMLKKRFDLIPNLVETVKQIMKHEQDLFENISKVREGISKADNKSEERLTNENELSQLTKTLSVKMEAYPELKSHENTKHLQLTLNDVEEQISAARRVYNNSVNRYNNSIETFPSNIIANSFNFQKEIFFETAPEERENISVKNLFHS